MTPTQETLNMQIKKQLKVQPEASSFSRADEFDPLLGRTMAGTDYIERYSDNNLLATGTATNHLKFDSLNIVSPTQFDINLLHYSNNSR